jgi:hypothetical protein
LKWIIRLRRKKPREYVELHYVSTKRNVMFKDKHVPCQWHHVVDASEVQRLKREAEERWPDVTVTIKPYHRR